MNRREFLKASAVAAASAALPGCGPGRPPAPGPNVVIFLADQLRAAAVGVYGDPNAATPHVDRLAEEGTTFLRALSTDPLCTPYRGMLMTGRYPTHSGVILNRVELSPEQNPDCLGNVFSRAGWQTGYLGKWHLGAGVAGVEQRPSKHPGGREGFLKEHPHLEFVPPGPRRLGFQHWEAYNYHGDAGAYWFYRDEPEKVFADGYETDVIVDQAIAYMEERRRRNERFLLVLSPHPPHPPYTPEHCPPGYLARVPASLALRPNVPKHSPLRARPLPARCYYAMIQKTDDALGRLARHLDGSGLSASTLLLFTSDHGEMLGSHSAWHKQQPYRESVEVPLVARWPGVIPAGVRSRVLQTPMDHLPTLCHLAGIEAPGGVDGRDLSSAFRGEAPPERDAVLLMNPVAGFRSFRTERGVPEWRGVRTEEFTYVRWRDGREDLFDDLEDPYQLRNLGQAPGHREQRDALRARLAELMAAAHDEFPPGKAYADWFGPGRVLKRTALGPVPGA